MSVATIGARGAVGSGKGTRALAWISQGAGVVGGAALMATTLGEWIGAAFGLFPALATILVVVGLVAWGVDIVIDRTPNRLAIWMSILLPSASRGVGGRVGAAIRDIAGQIAAKASATSGAWFGTASMLALAALGISVALLVARRVVRKGGG